MKNETESPPPRPPLRWYQYRLRTLFIIMTVFAAWISMVSHRARQQKLAVEKIRALGGTVAYDYQIANEHFNPNALPTGPLWLREFIGEDYFQSVVEVILIRTDTTDEDLELLENLPNLEHISLVKTKITSNGLSHLEGMKKLKGLALSNTSVDDGGLVHLKNLTGLRGLLLDDTKITDAGMVHLQKLSSLEKILGLANTQITNESLKYFKDLKKLEWLNLVGTQVTEEGIKDLKKELPKTEFNYTQNGENQFL